MMRHRVWLLLAILLGALLRGAGLFSVPPGPNVDEISNAIDAQCIWETGKDRHGTFLPLYLRAFDDYREGIFVLAATPLSAIITPWKGLRILSFAIGMITIVVTYGAVRRIIGPRAAIWGAFFIATDPQHVLWSRVGMEVILVPLGVAATWWSLSFFGTRPVTASLGAVGALLLTVYSGMMGKSAAAIMFVASMFVSPGWLQAIRRSLGPMSIVLILLFLGLIPAWWSVLSPEATARFAEIKDEDGSGVNPWINRAVRAATYWSPTYLIAPYSEGLPDFPWASKMGYAEWVCLMVGAGSLILRPWKVWNLSLLIAAILSVVPAAFTSTIAPSRVFFALPVLVIIMAQGTELLFRWWGSRITTILLTSGVGVTTVLISYDLTFRLNEHLSTFFWRDAALAVERLHSSPGDTKFVDAQIPFIPEEVIHVTRAPIQEYQGKIHHVVANEIPIGGLTLILPRPRVFPPGSLLLTWREQPTPPGELIFETGRFKIVEFPK